MIFLKGVMCGCCGEPIDITKAVNGVVHCDVCGYTLMLPKEDNPAALSFLRQGEHDLDTCKFDDAYAAYAKATELDPEEPEAYFGMALAKFKVQYLKDEVADPPRMQPICHEISDKVFSADKNYLHALELATREQKKVYRAKASEIDEIRDQFIELKEKGVAYDCFLCVKVTETDGSKTADYDRANDIYYHLKDMGYAPFFSEREMKNRTGADYEALILYALYCSQCMIIVCSNEEYLHTKWVKNEYTRFSKMIADEEKEGGAITFAYHGAVVEKLPNRKGKIQGIDLKKPDAYSRIEQFVQNHIYTAKQRREDLEREEKRGERGILTQSEFEIEDGILKKYNGQGGDVVIPDGVTAIGERAFENSRRLLRIAIPKSVTAVGDYAFSECIALAEMSIPNSVTDIGEHAFSGCISLTRLSIPYGVKEIGKYAFSKCTRLAMVSIPKSVIEIGDYAFEGCSSLFSITLPDDIPLIGEHAYHKCHTQLSINSLNIENDIVKGCSWGAGAAAMIPDGVTAIGERAFAERSLTSIIIPDSVTAIGAGAFFWCGQLESITLPSGLISIEEGTFSNCVSLSEIKLPSSLKTIGDYAFAGCSGCTNYRIHGLTNITIPNGVTTIGKWAFSDCECLKNITIPDSVTDIGECAFLRCSALSEVTIPKRFAGALKHNLKKYFFKYHNIKFTFTK